MITPHVLREALRSLSQARTRSSEQEPSGLLNPRPQGQGEPGTGAWPSGPSRLRTPVAVRLTAPAGSSAFRKAQAGNSAAGRSWAAVSLRRPAERDLLWPPPAIERETAFRGAALQSAPRH